MTDQPKSPRGFAAISPERQREIASHGGKAAHSKGTAHKFTSAEAQAAGKKGGAAVAQDRAHMAEIGSLGGRARRCRNRIEPIPNPPGPGNWRYNVDGKWERIKDGIVGHCITFVPYPAQHGVEEE
jgi:uncharacterized protein